MTTPMNEDERKVFDRLVRTRLARVGEVAHDVNLSPEAVLTALRALKSRELVAEQRTIGEDLFSLYYVTPTGIAAARERGRMW